MGPDEMQLRELKELADLIAKPLSSLKDHAGQGVPDK